MYHLIIQFSVWSTQFLPCVSLSVSPPGASTSRVITEVLLRAFFFYFTPPPRRKSCNCLSLWLTACAQQPLQPGGMQASLVSTRHCLGLLRSTRLQRNVHYFQRGCSFLGGPRHVSARSMCKYACVRVCICRGVCTLLLARFLRLNFSRADLQACVFAPKLHESRIPFPLN